MTGTFHGGIDDQDIVPGAAVQTILLLMWIIARGTNDTLITRTVRADIGADTDRARALVIRRLAPKHCQRIWVPGIDLLARDPPVSFRQQRTALAISLDVKPNYVANSKGRGRQLQKLQMSARASVRTPLYWTLHQLHEICLPNNHALLLPGRVRHQVHLHPSRRLQTFPPIAFDPTYPLKWTSTSRRPMTLV